MNLAIFDLDGTLTDTGEVDTRCYELAVCETLGLPPLEADWAHYPEYTDELICHFIAQHKLGRPATPAEIAAVQRRYIELFEVELARDARQFKEIAGAGAMLAQLTIDPRWVMTIATGSWQVTANFKLKASGLDRFSLPVGTADGQSSRADVVRSAMQKAMQHYKETAFERIISIGDGVWDVKTAIQLQLPFIGLAQGARAEALRQAGAENVLADYTDRNRFYALLLSAKTPLSGGNQ